MDEKGRNVIIVIVALIIAIIFGYVIMYIKTPSVEEEPIENNTTVVDVDMDNLNFSHYLYDIDGKAMDDEEDEDEVVRPKKKPEKKKG